MSHQTWLMGTTLQSPDSTAKISYHQTVLNLGLPLPFCATQDHLECLLFLPLPLCTVIIGIHWHM